MNPLRPGLRVVVDKRICVGTTNCAEAAPDAYDVGDSGIAEALEGASNEAMLAGARACPVGAITLHDLATGQLVTP